MNTGSMAKGEIVVVTGASGCLGQHIVKLLQEKDESCVEIRLYDKKPYQNNLNHAEKKVMKHFVADIKDTKSLSEAFTNADCVIHAAAVIDLRLFPDDEEMYASNVFGTKNVIDCCIKNSVPRLVFASSTDVVVGSNHIFYGTENTTPIPKSFMIGKYAETKCESEKLILEASGKSLQNGKELRTVSVRSTPFYGEEDKTLFTSILKITKRNNGVYYKVRSLDERLQVTYVGNAAWAHIKAKDRLLIDSTISGEAFFITDETPIIDIHEHARVFLDSRGYKVSDYTVPYWLAWIFLSLICIAINLINVFVKYEVDIPTVAKLNYLCSTFFYNRSKATLRLDYEPIYSSEESKERSLSFYSKVEI